jgi:ribosomal protein L37AE/L43A
MPREKCDSCGRFGAKKHVEDKGRNGLGGRQTQTSYLCERCEQEYQERIKREEALKFNKWHAGCGNIHGC